MEVGGTTTKYLYEIQNEMLLRVFLFFFFQVFILQRFQLSLRKKRGTRIAAFSVHDSHLEHSIIIIIILILYRAFIHSSYSLLLFS